MIHMKAIEIAGKFLPEKNEFFSHILNRFNKNYKCVMEEIVHFILSPEWVIKRTVRKINRSSIKSKTYLALKIGTTRGIVRNSEQKLIPHQLLKLQTTPIGYFNFISIPFVKKIQEKLHTFIKPRPNWTTKT